MHSLTYLSAILGNNVPKGRGALAGGGILAIPQPHLSVADKTQ